MSSKFQKVKITDISLDQPMPVNILITRDELLQKIRTVAQKKVDQSILSTVLLGILGGFYCCTAIHFGVRSVASLTTSHINEDSTTIKVTKFGPGVIRGLYAGFFPIGMLMVMINGADIFLMQLFYFLIALYKKTIDLKKALLKLLIVFMTNWIACIFYTWFFIYITKLFEAETYQTQIQELTSQYLDLNFFQTFLLGVGCGIVLSFAFMIDLAGKSAICRIISILFVVGMYPLLRFQHFLESLCLFPITLWLDSSFSEGDFIGKNLVPIFLGNLIGIAIIAFGYAIAENNEEKIQQNLDTIENGMVQQNQELIKNGIVEKQ